MASSGREVFMVNVFINVGGSPQKPREIRLTEVMGLGNSQGSTTWRIIPGLGSVVNNHGDRKSPKDRVVGPLPNGLNGL